MSVLTALPEWVQANVMAFLVPFQQGQGHECPVIATGVASRKHFVWTMAGYHWWHIQAAQFVEDVTGWINERILRQTFGEWCNKLAERMILRIAGVVDNRAMRRPRRLINTLGIFVEVSRDGGDSN